MLNHKQKPKYWLIKIQSAYCIFLAYHLAYFVICVHYDKSTHRKAFKSCFETWDSGLETKVCWSGFTCRGQSTQIKESVSCLAIT